MTVVPVAGFAFPLVNSIRMNIKFGWFALPVAMMDSHKLFPYSVGA